MILCQEGQNAASADLRVLSFTPLVLHVASVSMGRTGKQGQRSSGQRSETRISFPWS